MTVEERIRAHSNHCGMPKPKINRGSKSTPAPLPDEPNQHPDDYRQGTVNRFLVVSLLVGSIPGAIAGVALLA